MVGVSEGVKEDLVSMFPPLRGKVHTIYNGVPLDDVREQSVSPPAPATAPAARDEPYQVVAVGRLEAVKDYATLIDAAALLDDPRIAFTIVGEGSEHAARSAASMRGRPAPRCAWRSYRQPLPHHRPPAPSP